MEPELDMFDQWDKERSEKSWIVRKIQWIPLWWNQEGRYIHREIARGFKNIWYWFPVIWKDRHWDSHYIFDIMMHKIKAQSKYIGDRGIHTRAERDAEVMMTCVRLMKLVQDETYSSEYSDYHKTKHWFEPADKEGYSTWESRILEEDFDGYIKKYPLIEKRVMKGDGIFSLDGEDSLEIKQRIAMNIGQINHERANALLFKIMAENISRWWD
jgi:hypothetical protein